MEEKRNRMGRLEMVDATKISKSPYPLHDKLIDLKKCRFMRQYGQLAPIVVYEREGLFFILDGETTFDCLLYIQTKTILCYIIEVDDKDIDLIRLLMNSFYQPINVVMLSEIIFKIRDEMSIFDIYEISPYSPSYIKDLETLFQFDWAKFKQIVPINQNLLFE